MGMYDKTIGTLLVGIFFNTFLYGLVTYQFAAYYQTKFNDRPATKYMVLFLFILDTFHSTSAIYVVWFYTVANYDNPAALDLSVWPYQFTPIGSALAAFVTQMYLGFRIWCLTKSKLLYGVVIVLAVPSFVLGVACGIDAATTYYLSEVSRMTPLVIGWLSTQVVVDTFITVTLIIIFSRRRGVFYKTDLILNRLIRGAVQTGLFAGIFSICVLITFVVFPNTNFYGMFAFPIGRIYTNTLMDTLLARQSIRARMGHTSEMSGTFGSMSALRAAGSSELQVASAAQSAGVQIQVQRTIREMSDFSSRQHVVDETVPPASASAV